MKQSAECLQRGTSVDAEKALCLIDEALSISPYSETLLEWKANSLLMVCLNMIENLKMCTT